MCAQKRVRTTTVLQMEELECGAASLAMILAYYGAYIPLERLRAECGVSRDGSKASKIILAAKKFGLDGKGYRRRLSQLPQTKFPAIIFWDMNHFVVLEGLDEKKAYINDPGIGRRIIPMADFKTSYSGIVLEFTKNESFVRQGKKKTIGPMIRKRMSGMKTVLMYVLLVGLFLVIPGFVIPSFSRFFVDEIMVNQSNGLLKPLLIAMGLTMVIQGALVALQQYYLKRFHLKLALSSSAKFLDHLFKMPVDFFVQRMPGEICNRILANDTVATLISTKITGAVINLICVIFYVVIMLCYDVPLTLICIVVLLLNFLILHFTKEPLQNGTFKAQMEMGKLYGYTMNGISLIETLKASGLENDFFQSWAGQQAKVVLHNQKMARISFIVSQVPKTLTSVLSLLVLSVGALRVIHESMTIGMLVAFQALQTSFITPVNALMEMVKEVQAGKADMQRLDDVMDYPVVHRYKEDDTKTTRKLEGYVSLKNVTFGYDRLAPPFIEGLDLELKPGARIALVGGSGSGKSTVGKLVSSLFSPWSGEVLFDGKPLSEIPRAQFVSSVAVVDQDIFLFEGTVRDNLTMWGGSNTDEYAYIQAAKDACIHDEIATRQGGYFSIVEEGGKNYSGGQRQRLEIARALVGNPRILVLDEATSALDPVTEQIVDRNIRRRGCTCIIIAHRLSTIRDSDEILVLDNGKVAQRGTHDQLVAVDGLYRDLIKTM
ncbi:MAG: NHLP family bacteriocin export ABC transporter peptidase/permease/ATPase subunit [Spirochaetia bacterium]|nr:NHLP family bacteriocin export ABC transporter peptidase/permease/ATPase subunit [Spirochaetia bacterium]